MRATIADPNATSNVGDLLVAMCANEGTAAHSYLALRDNAAAVDESRSLADAVHYLGELHGRHPGVADHAAHKSTHPAARGWILQAIDGFAIERAYLARLVAAAGPMPTTIGQADCDAAVIGQLHALEMLAQSDRQGTALGAAIALVLDWTAIRSLLDRAAVRFSVKVPDSGLPLEQESCTVAMACAREPAIERAMAFGAQQLLAQHRGLWDLLDARRSARERR